MGNSHRPESHLGSACRAAQNTEPRHTWERSYLPRLAMGHPLGWVGFLAPLGEGELLNLLWSWDKPGRWAHTTERGEKAGVQVWHVSSPPLSSRLLLYHSAASPSQRVRCALPGRVPTAANLSSAGPGAHVVSLSGTTVGTQSLLPPWAWREFRHTSKP